MVSLCPCPASCLIAVHLYLSGHTLGIHVDRLTGDAPTGLSVFLFILTLWVLLRNRKKRRVNWSMVCASTALLAFSTMVRHPLHVMSSP